MTALRHSTIPQQPRLNLKDSFCGINQLTDSRSNEKHLAHLRKQQRKGRQAGSSDSQQEGAGFCHKCCQSYSTCMREEQFKQSKLMSKVGNEEVYPRSKPKGQVSRSWLMIKIMKVQDWVKECLHTLMQRPQESPRHF